MKKNGNKTKVKVHPSTIQLLTDATWNFAYSMIWQNVPFKTSEYAKEIEYIQINLMKLYNRMKGEVKIQIEKHVLQKFSKISEPFTERLSVKYLKRYVGIQGKKLSKEKAQRLINVMKEAVKKGKLAKSDPYSERLNKAYSSLVLLSKMPNQMIH